MPSASRSTTPVGIDLGRARKAIVAALARIAEPTPWVGRHLRDRVRTGSECRYESDPDDPVHCILHVGG